MECVLWWNLSPVLIQVAYFCLYGSSTLHLYNYCPVACSLQLDLYMQYFSVSVEHSSVQEHLLVSRGYPGEIKEAGRSQPGFDCCVFVSRRTRDTNRTALTPPSSPHSEPPKGNTVVPHPLSSLCTAAPKAIRYLYLLVNRGTFSLALSQHFDLKWCLLSGSLIKRRAVLYYWVILWYKCFASAAL